MCCQLQSHTGPLFQGVCALHFILFKGVSGKTFFLCSGLLTNQCLSPNQGKESKEVKEESAEERLRRRAYERGCQRLKKRIEGL